MSVVDVVVILVGGFFAGVINSMAGGGSLITVPLLSLAGVGGTLANGSNRVAILAQNASSAWGFARKGVGAWSQTVPVLAPAVVGSLIGSLVASRIDDRLFERLFGFLMLPLLVLSLRSKPPTDGGKKAWPLWATVIAFFGVGLYGGAVQAGVGILMLLVLARAGFDLVTANGIKVLTNLAITCIALPVFILNGQVRWLPAIVLSAGMAVGGFTGAHVAVEGGERVIRPVLVVVVLVLASRMLGLWDLFS
ncbi:MAG: sulfite exporter TauE/SafE family protein [Acidimicrobiales bacterium]